MAKVHFECLHVPLITIPTIPKQTELLQLCPPATCAEDKLLHTISIVTTSFKRTCSTTRPTTSHQEFEIAVNSPIMEQRQLKPCGSTYLDLHQFTPRTSIDSSRLGGICRHVVISCHMVVEYKLTHAIKKIKPDGCSGHYR